jgi:transposase
MRTYSVDLRRSIVRAYDAGQGSQRQLARLFGVSPSFVQKLLQHYRRVGTVVPKPHGGGHPGKITLHLTVVGRLRQEMPNAPLKELCERFAAETQVRVSRATMSRAVRRLTLMQERASHSVRNDTGEGQSVPTATPRDAKKRE